MAGYTKTMVMNYHPNHFAEAAAHFSATGGTWLDSSGVQLTEAVNLTWVGDAGDAYRMVSAADHLTISAAAEQAQAAAAQATADGSAVWAAVTPAQYAITDAEAAQFKVDEGFKLTDTMPVPPGLTAAAAEAWRQERQDQANVLAQAIQQTVNNLIVQDARAAVAMRAAGDFSPYRQTTNGHIQAMDSQQCHDALDQQQTNHDKKLVRAGILGGFGGGVFGGWPGAVVGGGLAVIGQEVINNEDPLPEECR
jgi:hypothetical protein